MREDSVCVGPENSRDASKACLSRRAFSSAPANPTAPNFHCRFLHHLSRKLFSELVIEVFLQVNSEYQNLLYCQLHLGMDFGTEKDFDVVTGIDCRIVSGLE